MVIMDPEKGVLGDILILRQSVAGPGEDYDMKVGMQKNISSIPSTGRPKVFSFSPLLVSLLPALPLNHSLLP